MVLYSLIPLFILLLAAFDNVYKGHRRACIFQVCALFFLVAGFRGTVGVDTYNYANIFRGYLSGEYGISSGSFEPFFIFLFWVVSRLTENPFGFFVVVAMLQSFLVFYISSRLRSPFFFLLFYSIVFYLQFHTNIIRAGTASLLFVAAMVASNRQGSLFFLFFSTFTHLSVLALIPVIIYKLKIKVVHSIFLAFLIFLPVMVFFGDYVFTKIANYLVFNNESVGMGGAGNLLFLVPPFVLIVFMLVFKVKSRELWISTFLTLIFAFGRNYFDIFYRLHMLGILCVLVIFSRDYRLFSWPNIRLVAGYVFLFLIASLLSVYSVVNEKRLLVDRHGEEHASNKYTWVPYETYFNDSY